MQLLKSFAFALAILGIALPGAVHAQTALTLAEAELAVPFGSAKGHLALVGDHLVFVGRDAAESLAIARADIASLDRSGDVVTVTTRQSLKSSAGARDTFRFRVGAPGDLVTWYTSEAAMAAAPAPAERGDVLASYQVKHDHRLGGCEGTLILTMDRVAFESINQINDSRQWQLVDIKEVELDGIYKLKVQPFLGDTFNFELTGKGMDSGEYRRLVDRIARARSSR